MKKTIFYLILVFLTFSCINNVRSKYLSYSDYKNSTFRKQSWFPDFVSKDSYELSEIHNIETNNSFGKFHYSNSQYYDSVFQTKKEMTPITYSVFKSKVEKIKSPNKPDWFPTEPNLIKMQFYTYQFFYIAVDKSNMSIFFIITY